MKIERIFIFRNLSPSFQLILDRIVLRPNFFSSSLNDVNGIRLGIDGRQQYNDKIFNDNKRMF